MAARLAALLACDAQLTEIIRLIGSVASEDIADMPTSRKRAGWTTANADTLRVLSHRPPVWGPTADCVADGSPLAHLHRAVPGASVPHLHRDLLIPATADSRLPRLSGSPMLCSAHRNSRFGRSQNRATSWTE